MFKDFQQKAENKLCVSDISSTRAVLRERVEALLFKSAHSPELRTLVERLTSKDAIVYMIGEMGCGKKLLARHLHETSGRQGRLVCVNCKVLGEQQLEAELFGVDAIAAPEGNTRRAGAFEAAHGGTLFLDEVEHLPPRIQVRLLRFIEQGSVANRTNAGQTARFDVRLIVGSMRDLMELVQVGRFRRDIYYGIGVAPIVLLPLRQRPNDIQDICDYFVQSLSIAYPLPIHLSAQTRELLQQYTWPGNLREVESVIHQAIINTPDGVITPDLIYFRAHQKDPAGSSAKSLPITEDDLAKIREILKEAFVQQRVDVFASVERTVLETAFEHFGRNQSEAADALSLSLNAYRSYLKVNGIV